MTVHEDLAKDILEDFEEDLDTMQTLTRLRHRHINGEMNEGGIWKTGYADAIGSSARFKPKQWPLHQHAAFLRIHALIGGGYVAYTYISTGGAPGPDADRVGNADKLKRTCAPFVADLDLTQNGADSDGVLTWDEELKISRPTGVFYYEDSCRKADQRILAYPASRKPGTAPLEVGDSWPSRTLMHLWQYGAVARWPYGSELIWLFLNYDWGRGRNR